MKPRLERAVDGQRRMRSPCAAPPESGEGEAAAADAAPRLSLNATKPLLVLSALALAVFVATGGHGTARARAGVPGTAVMPLQAKFKHILAISFYPDGWLWERRGCPNCDKTMSDVRASAALLRRGRPGTANADAASVCSNTFSKWRRSSFATSCPA